VSGPSTTLTKRGWSLLGAVVGILGHAVQARLQLAAGGGRREILVAEEVLARGQARQAFLDPFEALARHALASLDLAHISHRRLDLLPALIRPIHAASF